MKQLRDVLARVVMMGVAITQNGCCCPETDTDIDVDFDRTSPDISALIDRCQANPDDCNDLCIAALEEEFGEDAVYYQVADCEVTPSPDGASVHVVYWDGSSCGRAPSGLASCIEERWLADNRVARWLARAAYLEAASVVAFTHLAADLVRHNAPRPLIAAAIVAAHDEVRHAAILRGLVARAVPASDIPAVRVAPYRPASLRDLAMLNAIEGCGRETIGAAINLWQARCARDPAIRDAFASIARDELAHAELAHAIHAWASEQLDARDLAEIETVRRAVLGQIESAPTVDNNTRLLLGLPSANETRALVAALSIA